MAQPHTVTLTTKMLTPQFDYNVPYTTLCDGYRRAVVSRTTTITTTYDPPVTTTLGNLKYPEPQPTCTIPETACTAVLSSRASSISDYLTNNSPSPGMPHCTTYVPCNTYCRIHESAATVYYWPVTTTLGDFCAYNGSTIFAEPTSPPNADTVVTDGYTFTSPTNYISLEGLEGISRTRKYGQYTTCGGTSYNHVVVPITGPMTTYHPDRAGSGTLNLEDLNTIKYADFKGQRRCWNNPCTVVEGFYYPELKLPTEVLDLQPVEWRDAGCKGTHGATDAYRPRMVPLVTPAPVVGGRLV
jgi:hypothetical protein